LKFKRHSAGGVLGETGASRPDPSRYDAINSARLHHVFPGGAISDMRFARLPRIGKELANQLGRFI
jgi:hypothetical protein